MVLRWDMLRQSCYGENEQENAARIDYLNWLEISPLSIPSLLARNIESYAPPDTTKKNRNTQLVSIKLESITATSHGAYGNDSIIQIFRSLKRAPYHCPQVMLDCNYLWHGIGHDQESLGIPPIRAFEIPTKPNQYCSTNGMHRVVLTLMIFYCKPKLLPPWFDGGIYAVID